MANLTIPLVICFQITSLSISCALSAPTFVLLARSRNALENNPVGPPKNKSSPLGRTPASNLGLSITIERRPICAALIAPATPAGPPPMTTRSYSLLSLLVLTTPNSRAPVSGATATSSTAASLMVVDCKREGERMDTEDGRTMDVDVGTAVHAVAVGTANERRAAAAAEIFMIIAQLLALEVYYFEKAAHKAYCGIALDNIIACAACSVK
mmetsp:Transcript_18307/g.28155  ORF Transcript_18307/g.28155 Transcript_18307/m.28155 type:complete len:211 (-) Transcript_18307:3-635(-)